MVNSLTKELKDKNIEFKALAPTNKARRIINGETVHKFKATLNMSVQEQIQIPIHVHR